MVKHISLLVLCSFTEWITVGNLMFTRRVICDLFSPLNWQPLEHLPCPPHVLCSCCWTQCLSHKCQWTCKHGENGKLPHFAQVRSPSESYATAPQIHVVKVKLKVTPWYPPDPGTSKGFAVQWLEFKSWIYTNVNVTSRTCQFPVAAIANYQCPGGLKPKKFILSSFWISEAWSWGASKTTLPARVLGDNISLMTRFHIYSYGNP